ncbi:VWA domain-containing protein [Sphingobium sp. BS19]|uniref:vWA domain-containing protein n=1 Tax=Sphingobium sp. BS19 TaxID=3018973 RepID=UPI0022EE9BD2|nr:vWA domain-containing protein [Sphingobium sp. BS19]GLI98417.1 hypothetical protein Sbs19_22350 [Sphingobium sp. BS19]
MRLPISKRFSLISVLAVCVPLAACSGPSGSGAEETVSVTKRELNVGGIVKMRTETRTTEIGAAPLPQPQRPHLGNLTAGDYDDVLNPEFYAQYAGAVIQQTRAELPFVDTRTRVAVKVVDGVGRPVPQARIEVARQGGALLLISGADGIASFYPRFDHIASGAQISVASQAGSIGRKLQLSGRGEQTVTLKVSGLARPVSALDLVLVLDATGSMSDEMNYLQSELGSIIARVRSDAGNVDLRIGLIVYRDDGDVYVTRSFPLSGDIGAMREALGQQDADGGGDTPEAVDRAMIAAEKMQWRSGATKTLLLVADAPPHEEALKSTLDATERLRAQGVRIVPVAASGVEDSAQYVMRTMAVLTQGRYIFLTDDSGIGNAHAEPTVACYVVTRLDQLIARVLASIVSGRRVEPDQGEIIRTVGSYNAGRCSKTKVAMR